MKPGKPFLARHYLSSACDIANNAETQCQMQRSTVPGLQPLGAGTGDEHHPQGSYTPLWDIHAQGQQQLSLLGRTGEAGGSPLACQAMLRAEDDSCTAQGEVLLSCHTRSQTILPVSAASTSARGRVMAGGLQRKPASSRPLQKLFPENTEVKALLRLGGKKQNRTKADFRI